MRRGIVTSAVIGASIAMMLTACSTPKENAVQTDLTAADAKNQAQKVEDQLDELIPTEYVGKATQQSEGVLMACDPDTVSWAGGVTIEVQGTPDFSTLLRDIKQKMDAIDGFTSKLDADSVRPVLTLKDAGGASWLIGPSSDHEIIDISSFSPCFPTPEGMQPSDRY